MSRFFFQHKSGRRRQGLQGSLLGLAGVLVKRSTNERPMLFAWGAPLESFPGNAAVDTPDSPLLLTGRLASRVSSFLSQQSQPRTLRHAVNRHRQSAGDARLSINF